MKFNNVDVDVLKRELHYDPETGIFTRLTLRGGKPIGSIAGMEAKPPDNYIILSVMNVRLKAHRAAWAYMTGVWPTNIIDHIDLDKTNNRWENLREATDQTNVFNLPELRSNNSTGLRGVFKAGKKWKAAIRYRNKLYHLGTFIDPQDAKLAYEKARTELHII